MKAATAAQQPHPPMSPPQRTDAWGAAILLFVIVVWAVDRRLEGAKRLVFWGICVAAVAVAVLAVRMKTTQSATYGSSFRERRAAYVAKRPLPRNHRLRAEDLAVEPGMPGALQVLLPEESDLAGTYLGRDVKQGEPLTRDLLQKRPSIEVSGAEDVRQVPLGEQAYTLEWLDAGMPVQVYTQKESVRGRVVAVTCGKADDAKSCAALVAVPHQTDADASKWRLEPAWPAEAKK